MRNDKITLQGGIHTIAVKLPGFIKVPEMYIDAARCSYRETGGEMTTRCILNLNKIDGEIFTYSRFNELLDMFMDSIGVDTYKITRADMRTDSYDPEDYQKYAKLYRYLISMLAVSYQVNNTYRTTDLFTQKQLSVAVKNKYFECENYDKRAESKGLDMAACRLEERCKSLDGADLKYEFAVHWFKRWDKALENMELVHRKYNIELERIYLEDRYSDPVKFRGLTDFLIQYQNCIFCKRQMVELLSKIGIGGAEKAATRAKNHKYRYGIEYYSEKDVRKAVDEIKRSTEAFFNS